MLYCDCFHNADFDVLQDKGCIFLTFVCLALSLWAGPCYIFNMAHHRNVCWQEGYLWSRDKDGNTEYSHLAKSFWFSGWYLKLHMPFPLFFSFVYLFYIPTTSWPTTSIFKNDSMWYFISGLHQGRLVRKTARFPFSELCSCPSKL